MPLKLDDQPNLRPLGSEVNGLQVLLPELVLRKQDRGILLEVAVTNDLYALRDSAAKRAFFNALLRQGGAAQRRLLSERLAQFMHDPTWLACRLDCGDCPLRYCNGGVLPVLRLEGTDYFCLFYRDVFPIGWNIANGGADNLEEMLAPERILLREFAEELLLIDEEDGLVYAAPEEVGGVAAGTSVPTLEAWTSPTTGRKLREYRTAPLPLRWLRGPDQICVSARGRTQTTTGCFLSITPEDNGIEVDRIALITPAKNLSLFDGEMIRKNLLGRIIGLFPVEELMSRREDRGKPRHADHLPRFVFLDGERWSPRDFASLTRKVQERREEARARGVLDESVWSEYEHAPFRFGLCPVTRSILQRYEEWREGTVNTRPPPVGPKLGNEGQPP